MTLYKDPMKYDDSGRRSVQYRMQLTYGDGIHVLKGKACLNTSMPKLIGNILSPEDLEVLLGNAIYDEWAGIPNTLTEPSKLVAIEVNKASCYLIFKQFS